ncbi:MAG: ubiquinol-cytochrome c reductase iron-sulfur subunit [Fimbriimonadaceae bacterium]
MANEQQEQSIAAEGSTRRTALGVIVTVLNVGVLASLAVPAARFVLAPLSRRSKLQWVDVMGDTELAEGETREVTYTVPVVDGYQTVDRKYSVYLHRNQGAVQCFDPACTHLGCRITFQDEKQRYFCPCHGGVFDEQGKVVSGPPPTGLVEHPVKIKAGRIMVGRKV